MRISTQQMRQGALDLMLAQQARLAKTQQQMASGKRLETASDDPVAAVKAMSLTREIAATEQYQGNAEAVRARQSAQEDALAGATELLHSVRELMVQANNDTLNATDRQSLSLSLNQKVDELLGLANTSDGGGDYLFSGSQSGTQPFSRDGQGQVTYHGDQGQRMLGIGPSVTAAMTDSGAEVFQRIRAGNGTFVTTADAANTGSGSISVGQTTGAWEAGRYSLAFAQAAADQPVTYEVRDLGTDTPVASGTYVSGASIRFNGAEVTVTGAPAAEDKFSVEPAGYRDMFAVIQGAAQALGGAAADPAARAQIHTALNRSLAELDGALDHVLLQRARVGSRLNLVESQTSANDAFKETATETLSNVQDLDYAEATTRLQTQKLVLEAAQQSYVSIQGLSLFKFLN
jgi:flagellar hook-associated protein 3 FlgL